MCSLGWQNSYIGVRQRAAAGCREETWIRIHGRSNSQQQQCPGRLSLLVGLTSGSLSCHHTSPLLNISRGMNYLTASNGITHVFALLPHK